MRRRSLLSVTMAGVASLALAACGAPPTTDAPGSDTRDDAARKAARQVYDRLNGMSGQERKDELVRLAEEEGQLSIYTSNTDIDDLVEGFTDKYDIEVSVYRANSESALQRLLQENQAGYYGVDVFETNALELNVANDEGLLHPYEGELREQVRPEGQAEGWTASRFNAFVVGWNTNLVPPGKEPKSIEELAGPEWKGQVSMEVGDVDWFTALWNYYLEQGKSEAEVKDLFTRLASNSKVAKGHTVQGELLSAGQFGVTVSSYSHTIDKAAATGAPVAWRPAEGKPVEPIIVRPNGIGMMATAAHPAAAMLFVDYELTDGQQIFKDASRIGAMADGADPLSALEVVPVPEDLLLEDPKTWNTRYEEIVRAGQSVS